MCSDHKYKKILIISGYNLVGCSATNITLRSYFKQWPKDKLLILTLEHTSQPFRRTLFVYSVFLENFRNLINKILLPQKGIDNRNIVPSAIIKEKGSKIGFKQKIFSIGAAYIDMLQFRLPGNIIKEVENFGPEIIYTLMGSIKIIRIANKFACKYSIPIIPHFMDDWISIIYTGSFLMKLPRKMLLQSLSKLLRNTNVGFCISRKMCKEYEEKFNKKFYPLMNIVRMEYFKHTQEDIRNNPDNLIFTFFGGLHLNRWKTLMILSEVLNSLSADSKIKLSLIIYTSKDNINKYSHYFIKKDVSFRESIPHKTACLEMQKTDFLVHVESFDSSVIKFTRLSISTKIPEYLASGIPIIAIGPPNIASIEYLKENNSAYIITNLFHPTIKKIVSLAISHKKEHRYINNNLCLVEKYHSSSQLNMFKQILMCTS